MQCNVLHLHKQMTSTSLAQADGQRWHRQQTRITCPQLEPRSAGWEQLRHCSLLAGWALLRRSPCMASRCQATTCA